MIGIIELINRVSSLMGEKNIEIRDTWRQPSSGENFDDFYLNNGYHGPFRCEIIWDNQSYPKFKGGKIYHIGAGGFKSAAYNDYCIIANVKYKPFHHPLAHECVHLLQHTTVEEDKQYIDIDNKYDNYQQYLRQRVELEAHYIQCLYIIKFYSNILLTIIKDNPKAIKNILNLSKEKYCRNIALMLIGEFIKIRLIGRNSIEVIPTNSGIIIFDPKEQQSQFVPWNFNAFHESF